MSIRPQYIAGCILLLFSFMGLKEGSLPGTMKPEPGRSEGTVLRAAVAPMAGVYRADIQQGWIGVSQDHPIDNPYDNIFHVQLPAMLPQDGRAWLQYELYGVSDHTGVARSINDAQSIGGRVVRWHKDWSLQKEMIPLSQLHTGDNVIRFTLPSNAHYSYAIRSLSICFQQGPVIPAIVLPKHGIICYGDKACVKGILLLPSGMEDKKIRLLCDGTPLSLYDREFEAVIPIAKGRHAIQIKAVLPGGHILSQALTLTRQEQADAVFESAPRGVREAGHYIVNKGLKLGLALKGVTAGIQLPAGALPSDRAISVTALRDIDLPAIPAEMVNVTAGASGFRFLPHGSRFTSPALLTLPYDSTLVPDGYTAADIRTYFFDEGARRWVSLPLDTILIAGAVAMSRTTHFTDMINAIIKVPESPQTQGYAPTTIKDIKAADPSANITLIATPTAGPMGNASLHYDVKLPAGRQGMQPSLSFQYSNEGGNGWLGLGWSLSTPSIGIETRWGAPRYDPALETETYLLSGEQLAPIAYRDNFGPRIAEKIFHRRVEKAFDRIIRHGDNPANYWWEVTNKNGTRNYYGGLPGAGVVNEAVLKDAQGHIAHWALVASLDANNNSVYYHYQTVQDVGIAGGSVPGQQLYCDRISYTGVGMTEGAYTITFIRDRQLGEGRRKDVDINARMGFKMVSADLLRKIVVSFQGQTIRSYTCQYMEGAFHKTLLSGVSELNAAGNVFYTHRFDYYNDVAGAGSGAFLPVGPGETWSIGGDNIKGDLINPIPYFTGEGSALSTSKSSNTNEGLAITIGPVGDFWSKAGTMGGSFGFGQDNQEGLVSMIDINGDGLPDKVFKQNGQLFYRPNLGAGARSFGDVRPVTGAYNFSAGNGRNFSAGIQIIPFGGFLGYNHSNSTSTTTDYLSDFNGDGLMDIASNGQVLFNHLDANGNPVFTNTSTPTPSPITGSTLIDKAFLAPDTALQTKQEQQYPLQDAVRLWSAPFDGVVSITAPVRLKDLSQSGVVSAKKDGVRISIQSGGTVLWSTSIGAADHAWRTPAGVAAIPVSKGQKLYFRVQSGYNGVDDIVDWDPIIQYTNKLTPAKDASDRSSSYYQASQDFILHQPAATVMGKDGSIGISSPFEKKITSDSILLQITKLSNGVGSVIWQRAFADSDIFSGDLNIPSQTVQAKDQLFFTLSSDSYVDLSAVQWKPHYQYVAFADNTPLASADGTPTIQGYVVPGLPNYNDWIIAKEPYQPVRHDTARIYPVLSAGSTVNGNVCFSVKTSNHLVAKRVLQLTNGIVTNMDTISLIRVPGESYFFEFAASQRTLAMALGQPQVVISWDSIKVNALTGRKDTLVETELANASLYTHPAVDYFGPLFRGWGAFAYKGVKNGTAPLDESLLNINELNNYPSDPSAYTDPSSFPGLPNPSNTQFITLYADGGRQAWIGYDSSVYVAAAVTSSSRLWMHDVTVDSLMQGMSLSAANRISTTESNSYSAGYSVASLGTSNSTTTTNLDMMDLNGDRYPDVISETDVQFSRPTGELGQNRQPQTAGATRSEGNTPLGLTLGGHFPVAYTSKGTMEGAKSAQQTANVSIGLSGQVNINNSDNLTGWMDMNGDGLPDRVYKDGSVALNLGYSFAPAENWGIADIEKNADTALGAGLGVDIIAGTIEAGFGLTRSTGNNSTSLVDVNGDGLPDKVTLTGNTLSAQLNTGNGFADPIPWNFSAISRNVSTGESINGAFTIPIDIFVFAKIAINPSFSTGHGVSRRQDQIMDIDGDGYPDLLHSENDGSLIAYRSTIRRTNQLKTVWRPLGGYFSMDYQRMGNTYAMPQSKWVLSDLEIFDGVQGDGVDTLRSHFEYTEGSYNRREREFYGFSQVVTRQLNTAGNNSIYRSQVHRYLNDNYYDKGLEAGNWVEDDGGKKYTQNNNLYDLRKVQDSVVYPALIQTEQLYYEGQPTAGVRTYTEFDYDAIGNMIRINDAGDGTQQDMIMASVTYHDNDAAYIKSIPSNITVTTAEGERRRRSSNIDNHGNVTSIQQYLADGTAAVYDMSYDGYGNLSRVTHPANYKQQRLWYGYAYDDVTHSLVTQVTDAYGYSSSTTYDLRYGLPLTTKSIAGESIRYTLDNSGRISTITGPYELAAGKPYTIRMDYHPEAAVPYAVTDHYDPEYDDNITTVSFIDGLARPLQVKKQISLFKGKGVDDALSMVVSGRQWYDAMGRVVKNYYPTVEAIGNGNTSLFTGVGNTLSFTTYDVLDRPLITILADGAATRQIYTAVNGQFSTLTTDAMGNKVETLKDVRERQRTLKQYGGPSGIITTSYYYDALSELLKTTDNGGNATTYTYDNLGRKLSVQHPDAGFTSFVYDLAGNLTQKATAELHHAFPKGGGIAYQYDFERLTDIDYPVQYQNKVKYTYGAPDAGDRAGRLVLQEDASGGQEFFYGRLGEITKTIRTVLVNKVYTNTYVSEQTYDTWNRIKTMIYPDGETVSYHYNRGGSLDSIEGVKLGNTYHYVNRLGYDEFEQRVYMKYGNGTETQYSYDSLRRRMTSLNAYTASGRAMMQNTYRYDAVSNILGIVNNVQIDTSKLGGYARQEYGYDNLYRLVAASGVYKGGHGTRGYGLAMGYDNLYNIVSKKMVDSIPSHSYAQTYLYGGSMPHQPSQVGTDLYKYDLDGNLTMAGNVENFWDEDKRLMAVINKGVLSEYTYDAGGERIIKSSGGVQGVWVNGAPAGQIEHKDNYTAYVSPYLVCRKNSFTKHFYIESQRIVTKLGHGTFTNVSFPQSGLTAGDIDYTQRVAQLERARTDYYATLGVSPGPPTMKDFYAQPQNSGIAPPVIVDSTAANVPPGWPSNTTPPPNGPPIYVTDPPVHDSVKAGYGFDGTGHIYEADEYFYHPDHLGSTSYVTDGTGEVNQHEEYSPFGETFFEEHSSNYTSPYLFNAKERDEETGYYYYGARYYDPKTSIWLSVDPKAGKYPDQSPYLFCNGNPVLYLDPDGKDGIVTITGGQINVTSNVYLFGPGATKDVAAQYQKDVNSKWGGTFKTRTSDGKQSFNVNVNVNISLYGGKEKSNSLRITESADPNNRDNFIQVGVGDDRSYVSGGKGGEWRSKGREGSTLAQDDPAPHEVGHLLGLDDRYTDNNGPNKGWENNIMGNSIDGKVEQRNIEGVLHDTMKAYERRPKDRNNGAKEFRFEIHNPHPDK